MVLRRPHVLFIPAADFHHARCAAHFGEAGDTGGLHNHRDRSQSVLAVRKVYQLITTAIKQVFSETISKISGAETATRKGRRKRLRAEYYYMLLKFSRRKECTLFYV